MQISVLPARPRIPRGSPPKGTDAAAPLCANQCRSGYDCKNSAPFRAGALQEHWLGHDMAVLAEKLSATQISVDQAFYYRSGHALIMRQRHSYPRDENRERITQA